MKKILLMFIAVVAVSFTGSAAYQAYDINLSLTTSKAISIGLPYPLNLYFDDTVFRAKAKENLKGMIIVWNDGDLRNPAIVYLRSSLTGKTFVLGQNLSVGWRSFGRFSPKDKTVEGCLSLWLGDGANYYDLMFSGAGTVKTMAYKRWWSRGNYSVMGISTFKGQVAGCKALSGAKTVSISGDEVYSGSCCGIDDEAAVYGTGTIKYNRKISLILYRLSTRYNASDSGATDEACGEVESSDDGEELSADELSSAIGL